MLPVTSFLTRWETHPLPDDRSVVVGEVAEAHRGPSPELAARLASWDGAWYWRDPARRELVLVQGRPPRRPIRWLWHGTLLLLTVVTTLGAGAILQGVISPPMLRGAMGVLHSYPEFARFVLAGGWQAILPGWSFAAPLLGILLLHELGHYLVARRYAIDVSPPYFIPVPPNLSPIGGMGAFIRLRSAIPDRQQLLDVGAAGPVAGFVAAVAVLCWGYLVSAPVGGAAHSGGSMVLLAGHPVWLGDSLLTLALRHLLVGGEGIVLLSLPAFAGWVGLFVTGLNLLPLAQLDGGHILHALVGRRQSEIARVMAVALIVLGFWTPMWHVWVAFSFVIGRGSWGHPPVLIPERQLHPRSQRLGLLCIALFLLTFVPIPFPR